MHAHIDDNGTTVLYLSETDTAQWVAVNQWLCSTLYGHRVRAEWDSQGDIVDVAIDGCDAVRAEGDELRAITSDYLRGRYGPRHPAVMAMTP